MSDSSRGIALNVSRARLTILGFVLAVNVFAIGNILQFAGAALSEQIILELNILVALLCSVAIGTVSAVLFLISERFDAVGNSEVRIFAFAEMTMYVALSQTLNGLSQEFLNLFAMNLLQYAVGTDALRYAAAHLGSISFWLAAVCWGFVTYVAPVWSVQRMPVSQNAKLGYLGFYFVTISFVFYFNAVAVRLAGLFAGIETTATELFLKQYWVPWLWRELALLHAT